MGTRLNREHLASGFVGNASSSEPIDAEATELAAGRIDGTLPQTTPFKLTLEDGTDRYEVVTVTKVSPGPVFHVTRGQEGTEAVEHPTPCSIAFGITDQELADLVAGLGA